MAYSAQRAAYFNAHIAEELYKNNGHCANNTAYTRAQSQMFRRKPKGAEKILADQIEASYTKRSNICEVCHLAKARNGTCGC